jgi:NAD(P)-dependent dehydrogenase (short-subunit alcohol dehydrogenase family)
LFSLDGKAAVVTGGNSGIGLAMANGLAEAGAKVCIWGRNEDKNAAAAERLTVHGGDVYAVRCDVGSKAEVDDAFGQTLSRLGRVDVCVANAGITGDRARFTELEQSEWQKVIGVNLEGAMLTFQAVTRQMLDQGDGGSLIATSSLSAVLGLARQPHYAASKGGLNAMVRALAVELAPKGIRANSILPGWFETALTQETFAIPAFDEQVRTRIPMRRWGKPEDLEGLVVYLASDASRYHTGDSFVVDGGFSLV